MALAVKIRCFFVRFLLYLQASSIPLLQANNPTMHGLLFHWTSCILRIFSLVRFLLSKFPLVGRHTKLRIWFYSATSFAKLSSIASLSHCCWNSLPHAPNFYTLGPGYMHSLPLIYLWNFQSKILHPQAAWNSTVFFLLCRLPWIICILPFPFFMN